MKLISIVHHLLTIIIGYCPVLDVHTAHVACQFLSIQSKMDPQTGKVIEENPPFVKSGDVCMVEMIPMKPLSVETFADFAPLGRFAIRDMKQTVAVGLIKSVVKKEVESMGKAGIGVGGVVTKGKKVEEDDKKLHAGHHVAQ